MVPATAHVTMPPKEVSPQLSSMEPSAALLPSAREPSMSSMLPETDSGRSLEEDELDSVLLSWATAGVTAAPAKVVEAARARAILLRRRRDMGVNKPFGESDYNEITVSEPATPVQGMRELPCSGRNG